MNTTSLDPHYDTTTGIEFNKFAYNLCMQTHPMEFSKFVESHNILPENFNCTIETEFYSEIKNDIY